MREQLLVNVGCDAKTGRDSVSHTQQFHQGLTFAPDNGGTILVRLV
jgi:hypothetical protein